MGWNWLPTAAPRRSERETVARAGMPARTQSSRAAAAPAQHQVGPVRLATRSFFPPAPAWSSDNQCGKQPTYHQTPLKREQPTSRSSVKTGHLMSSISIIGTGNMARTIGALAVAGGNPVEVMGRDQSKAADLAKALGGGATTGEWGTTPAGDIVIGALLYDGVVPVVAQYGDALAGKIIVDISNPFNSAADGLAHREDTSIAQEVAKAAPASASVVKAFNTVFRHVLEKGRPDVFIAGDNAQAKAGVEAFIERLGLRPLDVGDLKMAYGREGGGGITLARARHGVGNWDFALGVTEFG